MRPTGFYDIFLGTYILRETLQTFENYIPDRLLAHFLKQLLVLSAKNEKQTEFLLLYTQGTPHQLSLRVH